MTSDSSANQRLALPAHDARRWAGTSWTCCSSAKWARRLLICATAPGSGICQILSDCSLSNMSRRDAVRWSPAKQVAGQPIPWPCKPPNPTAQSMLVFVVALFSVTGARCRRGPLLLVWSAVSSMLPHELPFRGGNDGIGSTMPPTTHRILVPVRSPACA